MNTFIKTISFFIFLLYSCSVIAQEKSVTVDAFSDLGEFNMITGTHGMPYKENKNFLPLYKKLGFKIIRNHDYYGPTDWYTIFPDWKADENNESSYDFKSSDSLILSIANNGFEILFRLGSSWKGKNNNPVNDPPGTIRDKKGKIIHTADEKDFRKFANICKHIVMHYNEGWEKGYHLNIMKWEIWNEPSLSVQFWSGNYFQFRQMFSEVASLLKKYDSSLIIGGPAQEDICREPGYFDSLLSYCKKENVPLDFYSFHTYGGKRENMSPYESVKKYLEAREKLDKYGFKNTYIICDEFNCEPHGNNSNTPKAASFIASFLAYSEEINIKETYFYRGDDHPMGLVDMKNGKEKTETYAFTLWKLLSENSVKLSTAGTDKNGFTITASKIKNENKIFVLVSNFPNSKVNVFCELNNLKSNNLKLVRKEISKRNKLNVAEDIILSPKKDGKFLYKFECPEESIHFIEIEY